MKLIYKPFGIVLGILAGLLSKKLFDVVWGIFDQEEPPKATTQEAGLTKVLAAAAVQGVTFKVTRAAVARAGAKGWDHLFGVWPGEKRQEPSQASELLQWFASAARPRPDSEPAERTARSPTRP
jgi:uncharacterized protein DUF4235